MIPTGCFTTAKCRREASAVPVLRHLSTGQFHQRRCPVLLIVESIVDSTALTIGHAWPAHNQRYATRTKVGEVVVAVDIELSQVLAMVCGNHDHGIIQHTLIGQGVEQSTNVGVGIKN